ncbi:MAG: hypothetical protein GX863_11010 [Firmicutes bacterium]|nr:hypothetical protein [Candidatus Fermentithermobacillaceae bacterium]
MSSLMGCALYTRAKPESGEASKYGSGSNQPNRQVNLEIASSWELYSKRSTRTTIESQTTSFVVLSVH